MRMSARYSRSPIVEAVCEFRLPAQCKWDLTVYGSIYEKLRQQFPIKQDVPVRSIEFSEGPGEFQQTVGISTQMQISTEDKRQIIRIGSRTFSLSQKSPYLGWKKMKSQLKEVFGVVSDFVEFNTLSRIGLRYINLVEIQTPHVKIEEYFNYRPIWPWGELVTNEVMTRCLFVYREGRDACRAIFSDKKINKENSSSFVLDFDYFLQKPDSVNSGEALHWVDEAHEAVESLFERSITDKTRSLLGVSQ